MNRPLPDRRAVLAGLGAVILSPHAALAAPGSADRLIAAARRQIGVTLHYDPAYTRLAFPDGDVPRSKGVCTDVVIRAYRDAFGIDLQSLIHADMRSANLCFYVGRARVVDWNHAQRANPEFDIAAWLPSLHAEGGPPPEAILPGQPELAAWLAGYFCARAGEPRVPDAPHVRPLQLAKARYRHISPPR